MQRWKGVPFNEKLKYKEMAKELFEKRMQKIDELNKKSLSIIAKIKDLEHLKESTSTRNSVIKVSKVSKETSNTVMFKK
jgi:hypothetical protein